MYMYVDSWSLPNNSIIHAVHFQNHQNDKLRCIISSTYAWDDVVLTQQPKAVVLQSGALFAWIEEADQNKQITSRDDPQEAQMAFVDLAQLERVHTKASSKIKRSGRSVSQRRMPRETEKSPLTMIDGKPTEGISTSKKDQDGHGVVKSESFQGVPNPDDELNKFFFQYGQGVMNVDFFPTVFLRFRTRVVVTAVCTTGGVHTHSPVARTFFCAHPHIFMRVHINAWLKCLKRSIACVSHLSISPSPFHVSSILAVPWRSPRDHSRLRPHWRSRPHVLAVHTCPESAGHAPLHTSIAKFGYLTKSDANTGYEPKKFGKNTSVDDDTTLINDPDQNTSDFSKTLNENTSQFGVHTVFESSVLHVSHWWCNRETVARQRKKRRFCDQCCRVDVKERLTERYLCESEESQENLFWRVSENSILMNEMSENTLNEELDKLLLVKTLRKLYLNEYKMEIQNLKWRNSENALISHSVSLNLKDNNCWKSMRWSLTWENILV